MKNLTTAIYTKAAGSAFSTAIGGRFYKNEAPQDKTWPYSVYRVVTDMSWTTFTDQLERVDIRFSLFSKTSSSTEVEDIFTNLKALYDNCSMTITGNTMLRMDRQDAVLEKVPANTETGEDSFWQYDVDYELVMKKN